MGAVRLGFICDPSNNAYYRAIFPMRALERRGHTVVWPARLGEDVPFRGSPPATSCTATEAPTASKTYADSQHAASQSPSITTITTPQRSSAKAARGSPGNRYNNKISREMLKMAATADLTTTPSEILAQAYRDAGIEHVKVIENYLSAKCSGSPPTPPTTASSSAGSPPASTKQTSTGYQYSTP